MTQAQTTSFPAIPGVSRITAKIVDFLKDKKPGEIVSDKDIEAACGEPVGPGEKAYNKLRTACRRLRTLHGLDFQRVQGAGCLKCMTSEETADTLDRHQRRIRREAHRGLMRAATVKVDEIQPEKRSAFFAQTAHLGVLRNMAGANAVKAFEASGAVEIPDAKTVLSRMIEIAKPDTKADSG